MRRPRQRVRVKRWTGRHCNPDTGTGIGPLAKQKAGIVLATDPRLRKKWTVLSVGLFLLDAFNCDDARCFPAVETIAGELGMTEKSVYRAINELRACDYLDWERHAGPGYTNLYRWNWQALFSDAAERTWVSDETDTRVNKPDMGVPQIRDEQEIKKEKITTTQKTALQKQEGRRKPERTHQPPQRELPVLSVVGGSNPSTIPTKVKHTRKFDTPDTADVWERKARERVQKVLSENNLWVVAVENDGAFEAAILAEKKKPGTCLQAFNAALEQSAEDAGKVAQCL